MTLEELLALQPEGEFCAFCGDENDNWDREGFFYLWTRPGMTLEEGEPACKACMGGEPGQIHVRLHGPGNGKR